MHICFISSEYPIWKSGGVGSFLQTFSRAMVQKGHHISIVGIGDNNEEVQLDDEGVNIYRLPISKLPIGKFISNTRNINAKIKRLNQNNKIDIVESAEMGLAFSSKISSIGYCIRLHGGHHFFSESENRKIHWWQGFKETPWKTDLRNDPEVAAILANHERELSKLREELNTMFQRPEWQH